MLLEPLGILGWQIIEPTILAALVNEYPILFIGRHGTCKTDGAEVIARAILGENCKFRKYDVPLINTDDLLGFPDPKSLAEGSVRYLPTPVSIWDAEAAIFDEINRAAPFIAAKIMEIVRTKRAMGMETSLKLVFSALNPPDEYDSIYMDLATASRFICVRVPGSREMSKPEIRRVIWSIPHVPDEIDLRVTIKAARELKNSFDSEANKEVEKIVVEIQRKIDKKDMITYSVRQLQYMRNMLLAAEATRQHLELPEYTVEQLVSIVTSTMPEIFGITRQRIDPVTIEGPIKSLISGFRLGDITLTAHDLMELARGKDLDNLSWAATLKGMITKETSVDKVMACARVIKKRHAEGSVRRDTANSLLQACMQLYSKTQIDFVWPTLEQQPFRVNAIGEAVAGKFMEELTHE